MKVFYTALFCIAGALAADELKKTEAAGGYYDIPAAAPSASYYGYGGYASYLPLPHLEDRNVCDLDASVLLVTDSRRHGHNRAVRVRCAEIASYDENSCNVCCQHAARRDPELKNRDMMGFLAVVNQTRHHNHDLDDEEPEATPARMKRGVRSHNWNKDKEIEVDVTYVDVESFKPDSFASNIKCVCCAPKRKQPQPIYYPQAAPVYGAPAAAAPAYGAPAAAAPAYGTPAAAAPVYSAPAAAAPAYSAPAAAAPAYSAPAAAAPAYGAPAAAPSAY